MQISYALPLASSKYSKQRWIIKFQRSWLFWREQLNKKCDHLNVCIARNFCLDQNNVHKLFPLGNNKIILITVFLIIDCNRVGIHPQIHYIITKPGLEKELEFQLALQGVVRPTFFFASTKLFEVFTRLRFRFRLCEVLARLRLRLRPQNGFANNSRLRDIPNRLKNLQDCETHEIFFFSFWFITPPSDDQLSIFANHA